MDQEEEKNKSDFLVSCVFMQVELSGVKVFVKSSLQHLVYRF